MRFLFLLCLSLPLSGVAGEARVFSSGASRVHLIELYSSEGCSSCPPAEDWLGRLNNEPGLWRSFVPVSFHVNYWDRLGWRDRFATREFTERQYAYVRSWRSDSVYTPEFVLDGAEWHHGFFDQNSGPVPGVLTVSYEDDQNCRVSFSDGEYEAHVALLGNGIISRINAGENSGSTLKHEFVVFALAASPLKKGTADIRLAVKTPAGVSRRALAVWITKRDSLTPVQATGGWLD
jgi:hypothetical protein